MLEMEGEGEGEGERERESGLARVCEKGKKDFLIRVPHLTHNDSPPQSAHGISVLGLAWLSWMGIRLSSKETSHRSTSAPRDISGKGRESAIGKSPRSYCGASSKDYTHRYYNRLKTARVPSTLP